MYGPCRSEPKNNEPIYGQQNNQEYKHSPKYRELIKHLKKGYTEADKRVLEG